MNAVLKNPAGRTTKEWQAADAAHYLHPFTDFSIGSAVARNPNAQKSATKSSARMPRMRRRRFTGGR